MANNRKYDLILVTQTKRLGIAVFDKGEVVHSSVKTFRPPRSLELVAADTAAIMDELITKYCPQTIIIKPLGAKQANSAVQKCAVIGIIMAATGASIEFKLYDFETAKSNLMSRSAKPTNASTFSKLAKVYPELTQCIRFRNASQKEYYSPMLTATAIGLARHRSSRVY